MLDFSEMMRYVSLPFVKPLISSYKLGRKHSRGTGDVIELGPCHAAEKI